MWNDSVRGKQLLLYRVLTRNVHMGRVHWVGTRCVRPAAVPPVRRPAAGEYGKTRARVVPVPQGGCDREADDRSPRERNRTDAPAGVRPAVEGRGPLDFPGPVRPSLPEL